MKKFLKEFFSIGKINMEELRSTKILDLEIQEDARRKADKILKNVDFESKNIQRNTDQRIEKERQEKKEKYQKQIETYRQDVEAKFPLEKGRFLVSYQNEQVEKIIATYVHNLGEEKQLSLLRDRLSRYKDILQKQELIMTFNGFNEVVLKKLVESENTAKIISSVQMSDVEIENEILSLGMILETSDKKIKCRIIMKDIVEELLDKYRFELVSSLFGKESV
ncbi:MAG: hypothetical protein ACRC5H_06290 [Treponemataceae bacterium]